MAAIPFAQRFMMFFARTDDSDGQLINRTSVYIDYPMDPWTNPAGYWTHMCNNPDHKYGLTDQEYSQFMSLLEKVWDHARIELGQ